MNHQGLWPYEGVGLGWLRELMTPGYSICCAKILGEIRVPLITPLTAILAG